MAYFPFMIDVSGKKCLVVGGGKVACHKVKTLLDFDVKLYVVAPFFDKAFDSLEYPGGQVLFWKREFVDSDIDGMDFVIAATNEESINMHISELCRERGILVNAVDMKEACSFIFPAMIREEDMLVAISSGGQSPAAVSYLKQKLKKAIPDYYGEMTERLGEYREDILQEVALAGKRKEIFYRLLQYGDSHEGEIPETEVRRLIEEAKGI